MDIKEEDLKKRYVELPTDELLKIIDNKFGYTDLAVKLAISELSRRNLSESDIHSYKSKVTEEAREVILKIAHYDLRLYQKILFYIFWLPIFNFPFKMNFRENEEYLKIRQANYYSLFGFVFFFISGIVTVFFELSDPSGIFLWLISIIPAYIYDERFNRQRLIKKLNDQFQSIDASNEEN